MVTDTGSVDLVPERLSDDGDQNASPLQGSLPESLLGVMTAVLFLAPPKFTLPHD